MIMLFMVTFDLHQPAALLALTEHQSRKLARLCYFWLINGHITSKFMRRLSFGPALSPPLGQKLAGTQFFCRSYLEFFSI